MSSDSVTTWLNQNKTSVPALTDLFAEAETYASQKLWYQLTLVLEKVFTQKLVSSGDKIGLVDIFENVVRPLIFDLDVTKSAEFCALASRELTPADGIAFLDKFSVSDKSSTPTTSSTSTTDKSHEYAKYILNSARAKCYAALDRFSQCDVILESGEAAVKSSSSVLPNQVASFIYDALAYVSEKRGRVADFANYVLLLLSVINTSTMTDAEITQLAEKLMTATILSPKHYSFTLNNTYVKKLGEHHVLHKLALSMNYSSWEDFQTLLASPDLPASLQTNKEFVTLKFKVIQLLSYVHELPFSQRVVSFSTLCDLLKVDEYELQKLLLFSMHMNTTKIQMNGLDKTVTFNWILPRELDTAQLHALAESFEVAVKNVEVLVQYAAKSVQTHQLSQQ